MPPELLPDGALVAPAVEELLDRRGRALLARDRAGFLATVDASATAFLARQAALFDALAEVPLTRWSYAVDPAHVQPDDSALTARYGTWWAPAVTLRHALEGDVEPFAARQSLTFVLRADGWRVAADDDFAARGAPGDRALWDAGPVVATRGARSLVLAHPADRARLPALARAVDAAVPRVTQVWGEGWPQRVTVLVPADARELDDLVDVPGGLDRVVALALAGPGGQGDRVLVNPGLFDRLGPNGLSVVLAHEITHVAARPATGPVTPRWLSEGLADLVGFAGQDVTVAVAAAELAADVRAGRGPAALPRDEDFAGDAPGLAQAYEGSWLAVELLQRTYGRPALLALYRELGTRTDPPALEELLRERLGTSTQELTSRWSAALREQLG